MGITADIMGEIGAHPGAGEEPDARRRASGGRDRLPSGRRSPGNGRSWPTGSPWREEQHGGWEEAKIRTLWPGLAGMLCLALFLVSGLYLEHVRERPVYERPSFLLRRGFQVVWGPGRAVLFVLGWIVLGTSMPRTALAMALLLAALWAWKRFLRSRRHRHRMIREAFDRERARDPSATDVQILQRILHSLHGRWGGELIEQIVLDNPTPEGVADMVVRMERGSLPSGFDPARMLGRRR